MPRTHTVKSGDVLWRISARYYGTSNKWTDIVSANPQLKGRGKASDGSPLIFPGDALIIPDDEARKAERTPAVKETVVLDESAKKDLALYCDGKKFTGFTGYTLVRSVDTFDAFSFSSPWDAENKDLRELFRPFSYKECDVYFDGEMVFKGRMMPAIPQVSENSKTISIQGTPLCAVLNDSVLPDSLYPPEFNGLTLKEIAEKVCKPFSVGVKAEADTGAAFESVEIGEDDKVLDFLAKLAKERGVFLSNDKDGSLLIWKPEDEKASAFFKEGEWPFVSCTAELDGQKMFSHVTGMTKVKEDEEPEKYTYENKYLTKRGVLRCYAKTIDDTDAAGIEEATKAMALRMFAEAVKYTLTVSGHRDKGGKLYRKNMTVSVLAPDAEIYKETKMQVDEVEMKRGDSDGETTVLHLTLLGARSGNFDISGGMPWDE